MSVRRLAHGASVLAVGVVLAVSLAAALPTGQMLVVETAGSGEPLLRVPVEENSTVALEYTHSVERSRVLDVYRVRDGELVMTRMEFESYGWGLPSREPVAIANGTFVADPAWAGSELYVAPGRIAEHELHVDGETYNLFRLADGASVRIHLVTRSPVDRMFASTPA